MSTTSQPSAEFPKPFLKRLWQRFSQFWFGMVDPRPAALTRIVLALLLIKDVLYRFPLINQYFTDDSLLPRWTIPAYTPAPRVSLLTLNGESWLAVVVLGSLLIAACCLLIGWHTRIASVVCFILLMSVQNRTEFILDGSDFVLRLALLWGMFSAWGNAYSVDSRLNRSQRAPNAPIWALPIRLLQLQIGLVYFFTGIDKLYGVQWTDGSALYRVLQLKTFLLPTGELFFRIAPYPVVVFLNFATIAVEISWLFLVFSPVLQPHLRRIALMGGMLLHVGIASLMSIPNFSWVMLASYLLFLEPNMLARVDRWLQRLWLATLRQRFSMASRPVNTAQAAPGIETRSRIVRITKIAVGIVLCAAMGLAMWWSAAMEWPKVVQLPMPVSNVVQTAGLWQNWKMFSPDPVNVDRWIVFTGTFSNGQQLDLRTGATGYAPGPRYSIGPELRTRKYDENIAAAAPQPMLEAAVRYFCRRYNDSGSGDIRLASVAIRMRMDWVRTTPQDAPRLPVDQPLYQEQCRG